jgi:hypothetical protein
MNGFQSACATCSPACQDLLSLNCTTEYVSQARIGYSLLCDGNTITTNVQHVYSDWEAGLFKCPAKKLPTPMAEYQKLRVTISTKVLDHFCATGEYILPNQPSRSSNGAVSIGSIGLVVTLLALGLF